MCYNGFINKKTPIETLIERFLRRGGKIDRYYLRDLTKSKRTLVYLKGWYSGTNIREAITKAFGSQ
ncbi:hypothetical protein A2630_02910 [Candidatus Woesebacteria bacterium RIFCSPHIGHO2_01_FULL_44_10]|uniref:Uncharacterized protein n=1 Tax=Candidatus Woesebacteria bacterium RIFCSPLOWO2_01_FULL_44_14 TaxID=1802525 RepID=A0A1F8C3T5_9BACT|nr:MAG: hypothetical protein A2630_02910 [Candidatus Woesebacteria bacterium RIFCSPHIGHO2_01_FULL_44_10]OGM55734.1 MAG: hypothetical protein A3F62_04605 [Candidatus Woesebacteria bacterium RIFCSPHIGHO2_12_FULL_44_11]OGM70519.1 MAG: hypothetical protein A2975_01940 [Candidatus Woesebacteria bacterium RIFCSPLOWO2_01_FULL_44_14]